MKKLNRENIKTILLIFLIVSSFIQIGIHLSQQIQPGFPFRFIEEIFSENNNQPSMDVEYLKNEYFVPESIVVSVDPESSSNWKLHQNDVYYKNIWRDIKENYLPQIVKEKPKVMTYDSWANIISKRCIKINFEANWPSDIIFWFEDKKPSEFKGFSSIKAMAILPQENVNQTVNTVYIFDQSNVYQYNVDIKDDYLPKSFYVELADKVSNQGNPGLTPLKNLPIFMSDKDIYVSLSNDWNSSFSSVNIDIPSSVILNQSNLDSKYIQDSILLKQKDSLTETYSKPEGEAIFTDTENVYKLYENGILEYKYLSSDNADAGNVSSAFSRAVSFIELRRDLLGEMDIVLSDIRRADTDNCYVMQFEYQYEGISVYFADNRKEGRIVSPITIKANSERVLECQWVIRSLSEIEEIRGYNLYFLNLIEKQIPALYPEIIQALYPEKENVIGKKGLTFERIEPGYVFSLDKQINPSVSPQWVISTDMKDYFIPLLSKGG